MNLLRISFLLVLWIGLCADSAAQRWLAVQADTALPRAWRGPHRLAADSNAVGTLLNDLHRTMLAKGYLEASCDTCTTGNDTLMCTFHLGPRYRWARLGQGDLPPEIASAVGFRERLYLGRPVVPRELARLFRSLLAEAENNGHPFATVRLDSLSSLGEGLGAVLRMDRGRPVTWDSVVVKGTARITPRYLQAYIGIRPGDRYNESRVVALGNRLRELPFITSKQAPYVLFTEDATKLYLFLDDRKASSFNGVLGIQPDAVTGAVRLTGDIDLRLRNALRRGEAMDLNWRSLQDRTQDLKVRTNLPYLFNTPFGVDLSLKLFKRDTTFLEVTSRAAMEYLLDRGDKVSVFLNNKSSRRLGQLTIPVPGLADVKLISYGIGLVRERFDYRPNPRKGLGFIADGSVGNKRTNTATFTDTLDLEVRSIQYDLNASLVWHIPIGKRGTVRLAAQGGAMVNDRLYTNELYRIGGLRTMRGMDEASTYCSSYAIGTIEYRFLFEENGNFFVFADQGWWEDASREALLTDTPAGFGAGLSFETKAGIFSLTYALGRQFNAPVELRAGKIHFGFTSLF